MVAITLFIGPLHGGDEPLMSNDSAARSASLPPVLVMRIAMLQRLVDDAVGIDERLALVDAVGDGRDLLAHLPRRAPLQLDDRGVDGRVAVAVEQRGEPRLPGRERRRLRLDVADALVGDADVRQDDRQDLVVEHALLVELDRRQAQALLLDLGRVGREAARHHAAGVGPVAGVGEPAPEPAVAEERLHELDVHQVRAAEVRIVDDEDVARLRARSSAG